MSNENKAKTVEELEKELKEKEDQIQELQRQNMSLQSSVKGTKMLLHDFIEKL